ncbi:MAG: (d)CMP kinase [Anaerolineae bacterium]|nr:(d)CMP kinase [Anaerolineae bacterium]
MTFEARIAQPQTVTRWPAVVTMDGPAGSGKSTIGARVAHQLGYLFFDSGILYRALTWLALRQGIGLSDGATLVAVAERMDVVVRPATQADGRPYTVEVDGEDITWDLRRPEVDVNVSEVSKHAGVRAALIPQQRRIAAEGGLVMVGRDIGTVVLPDAPLKIYLDAALEVRARRRLAEQRARGRPATYRAILDDMRRRDQIDGGREVAPMKPAADAILIDTTTMTIDQVVEYVLGLIEQGRRRHMQD